MASRALTELILFVTPFVLFATYLWLTRSAEREGRRKWPINALFLSGLGLAIVGWLVMLGFEGAHRNACRGPSQMVDGKVVPGEAVACQHDNAQAGRSLHEDPGGEVELKPDDPS